MYLYDPIKNMHDDMINKLFFEYCLAEKRDNIKKNKKGTVIANMTNTNLNMSGFFITLVTIDKIIKCKGVCTKVQSLGFANKFSCNAIIKP